MADSTRNKASRRPVVASATGNEPSTSGGSSMPGGSGDGEDEREERRRGTGRKPSRKKRKTESGRTAAAVTLETKEEERKERQHIKDSRAELERKKGEAISEGMSYVILMFFFGLVSSPVFLFALGFAAQVVCQCVGIHPATLKLIRDTWRNERKMYSTDTSTRGKVIRRDDKRVKFMETHMKALENFISSKHNKGECVFKRDMRKFLQEIEGVKLSKKTITRVLRTYGYMRKRGRLKVPELTPERKERILLFVRQYNEAKKLEAAGTHVIVYMDESFVHQWHASPYSFFKKGCEFIGRLTGKGKRLIIVHAITKDGPLVTEKDGFPISEGRFKAKGKGKATSKKGKDKDEASMVVELTGEWVWEARTAKGDYHATMDDDMFMQWLTRRLIPAFRAKYGGKKMILVLDNAPYHHGYDKTVKNPSTNTKLLNTELLRKYGVKKVTSGAKSFLVPSKGGFHSAPAGPSREDVALALRLYMQKHHPLLLQERVDALFSEQDDLHQLIWTPPYMPGFQPIELFWQHGKHYVSREYFKGRTMRQVWAQLRLGWYGDRKWQGGVGWNAADCGKLVGHAEKEMIKWVKKYGEGVFTGDTMGGLTFDLSDTTGLDQFEGEEETGVDQECDEALEDFEAAYADNGPEEGIAGE